MATIELVLTDVEANELKAADGVQGTELAERITALQAQAVQREKERAESKKNSRRSGADRRKARVQEMKAKAAEFDRLQSLGKV